MVTNIRDYARKEEEGTLIYRTSISNENERKFEFFEEVSVFLSLLSLSLSLSLCVVFYRSCLVLSCFMREFEVRRRGLLEDRGVYPFAKIRRRGSRKRGNTARTHTPIYQERCSRYSTTSPSRKDYAHNSRSEPYNLYAYAPYRQPRRSDEAVAQGQGLPWS